MAPSGLTLLPALLTNVKKKEDSPTPTNVEQQRSPRSIRPAPAATMCPWPLERGHETSVVLTLSEPSHLPTEDTDTETRKHISQTGPRDDTGQ